MTTTKVDVNLSTLGADSPTEKALVFEILQVLDGRNLSTAEIFAALEVAKLHILMDTVAVAFLLEGQREQSELEVSPQTKNHE